MPDCDAVREVKEMFPKPDTILSPHTPPQPRREASVETVIVGCGEVNGFSLHEEGGRCQKANWRLIASVVGPDPSRGPHWVCDNAGVSVTTSSAGDSLCLKTLAAARIVLTLSGVGRATSPVRSSTAHKITGCCVGCRDDLSQLIRKPVFELLAG